ncbi:MAG TPA: CoA transferase [Burkholderiaceae bacterium]|nr:CoA transferase [Burkholderiaceae bacterium]
MCTQIMGDYGAEIVRLEPPSGDIMRHVGPLRDPGMGHMHLQLGRNKRSVALDLRRDDCLEAAYRLVKRSDIVVSNMRPDAAARLGLDYASCKRANDSIVYLRIAGFGQRGPYAGSPAYDDLIQAGSGLSMLFRDAGDAAPRYVPANLADRVTGLTAAHAAIAGLLHRERTGEGQEIEVPMYESVVSFLLGDHLAGESFSPPQGGVGYPRVLAPERRPYRTKDGYVCALPYLDKHWLALFDLVGQRERYGLDPRFSSITARTSNAAALYELLGSILATRTTAEWLEQLKKADIPCSPVRTVEDLLTDRQLVDSGFLRMAEHPAVGRIREPGSPVDMSRTPTAVRRSAPGIGEHTAEVLTELGYREVEIQRLGSAGSGRRAQ